MFLRPLLYFTALVYYSMNPATNVNDVAPVEVKPPVVNATDFQQRTVEAKDKYGLHNHLLSDITLASDYDMSAMRVFSKRVEPRGQVTNQASSGRCWMYAALNMLRLSTMKTHDLPTSFEFSQKYLYFWDKLERVNYFLDAYDKTKTEDQQSRLVQFLLNEPLGDGGQWQMFVNLVEKYGLVPQSAYPESKHSQNSRGLNMVLTKKLREYGCTKASLVGVVVVMLYIVWMCCVYHCYQGVLVQAATSKIYPFFSKNKQTVSSLASPHPPPTRTPQAHSLRLPQNAPRDRARALHHSPYQAQRPRRDAASALSDVPPFRTAPRATQRLERVHPGPAAGVAGAVHAIAHHVQTVRPVILT